MAMPLGQRIAEWLRRRVDPSGIYDHRILHELAEANIYYDEEATALWTFEGDLAFVTTYTPAELIRHPVVEVRGLTDTEDRSVLGYEIAAVLHMLLWPTENPPGNPRMDAVEAYERNLRSLAERGERAYRDPSGGWQ